MDRYEIRSGIRAFDSLFGGMAFGSVSLLIGRTDLNFTILDRLAVSRALLGDPVYYIDGAGRSDPFSMARLLRARREDPVPPLSRINVARAFTAHQLDSLIVDSLPSMDPPPALALASGIDTLLSDPEVGPEEAEGMMRNCASALENVARAGAAVLVAATGGGRGADLLRIMGPISSNWASLKERPGKRIRIVVKDGRWADLVRLDPMQTIIEDFGEAGA